MIWKCEFWNGYGNKGFWSTIEIVGEDFETELRRRFGGTVKVRNVKWLNTLTNEWEDWEV